MRRSEIIDNKELTVITKAKDLCSYILTVTEKSPKRFRFTLTSRMQNLSLELIEQIYRANEVYLSGTNREAAYARRLDLQHGALTSVNLLGYMALLALGIFAAPPMTAYAVDIGTGDDLTDGPDLTGTEVYFGVHPTTSNPILWHVVETGGGTATLWTTTSMGDMLYDSGNNHNSWSNSSVCDWLNGTNSGDFLYDAFSSAEQGAITDYGTTEQANPAIGITTLIDIDQPIVLPSVAEIGNGTNTGTWDIPYNSGSNPNRAFGANWWLRSPGNITDNAALVNNIGLVNADGFIGNNVPIPLAIHPAFKLNLSSAIFTSTAASGGASKYSGGAGSSLSAPQAPTGAVKLTVLDSTLAPSFTALPASLSGRVVTLDYSNLGGGDAISARIMDNNGNLTHAGLLASTTNASGTVEVEIPASFDPATDTLEVFAEQLNAANTTDYAGGFTQNDVSNAAPTTPQGVNPAVQGGKGKITGVDTTMEYSDDNGQSWTDCTGTEIPDLNPGSYQVRYEDGIVGSTVYLDGQAKTISITAPGTPPDGPGVDPLNLTITTGQSKTFTVSLGQSGNEAASAAVTSDNTAIATISYSPDPIATPGTTVTVTGVSAGQTTISVDFSGGTYNSGAGGTKTVHVTVQDPAPPAPLPPSRDSGSGSDSGSSYIPPTVTVPSVLIVDAPKARAALSAMKPDATNARISHGGSIKTLAEAWAVFGKTPVNFDTLADNAVQVRITVPTPDKMTKDMMLSGFVKGSTVDSRKALFEKWFSNKVRIIHLEQTGVWGQPVEIAAKVDLTGMDTTNLYFYAYDKATNTYRRIENPRIGLTRMGICISRASMRGTL